MQTCERGRYWPSSARAAATTIKFLPHKQIIKAVEFDAAEQAAVQMRDQTFPKPFSAVRLPYRA